MKRDMDLIRDILLKVESGQKVFAPISSTTAAALGVSIETPMSDEEADQLRGHLDLLEQEKYIEIEARMGVGLCYVKALTWKAHDFLDSGT